MFDYDAFFDDIEKNLSLDNSKESIQRIEERLQDPEITNLQKSHGLTVLGDWLWDAEPYLQEKDIHGIDHFREALKYNPNNYHALLQILMISVCYPFPQYTVVTEYEAVENFQKIFGEAFQKLSDDQREQALKLLGLYLKGRAGAIKAYGYSWYYKSQNVYDDRDTSNGHAWELLFNGRKPTYEEIQWYLAEVIENGELHGKQGGGVTKKCKIIDGFRIWVKLYSVNGKQKLVDAGLNVPI
jgi:hypothetical protein